MVSSAYFSLVVVVLSLASGLSLVDADSSINKNLRGVFYQITTNESVAAPAPAPSIRILQGGDQDGDQDDQGEDDVPTLSPVIIEYWAIEGDGYGKPPDEVLPDEDGPDEDGPDEDGPDEDGSDEDGPEKTVLEYATTTTLNDGKGKISSSDATTTDTTTLNEDDEGAQPETNSANGKDDDNEIIENNKSKSSLKDDQKWVFMVYVLGGAAFLVMLILFALGCRSRRRDRREHAIKQAAGEKAAAAAAAANLEAACDPTETDREFSEHPHIQEIFTDSDNTSETSSVFGDF
jgi:hypothetical protein